MKAIQLTESDAERQVTVEWGVSEGDNSFVEKVAYMIAESYEEIDDEDPIPDGYELTDDD